MQYLDEESSGQPQPSQNLFVEKKPNTFSLIFLSLAAAKSWCQRALVLLSGRARSLPGQPCLFPVLITQVPKLLKVASSTQLAALPRSPQIQVGRDATALQLHESIRCGSGQIQKAFQPARVLPDQIQNGCRHAQIHQDARVRGHDLFASRQVANMDFLEFRSGGRIAIGMSTAYHEKILS
jgi:hypothetical protein